MIVHQIWVHTDLVLLRTQTLQASVRRNSGLPCWSCGLDAQELYIWQWKNKTKHVNHFISQSIIKFQKLTEVNFRRSKKTLLSQTDLIQISFHSGFQFQYLMQSQRVTYNFLLMYFGLFLELSHSEACIFYYYFCIYIVSNISRIF